MAKVEVISSCLVGMTSNTSSMSRLELTPWDLQLLLLEPIQRGILFHNHKMDRNFIHHLKNSLSRTLDFFPPLSGRIGTTQNDDNTTLYFVDCNNAGVEFTHALADVSISDILEANYIPEMVSSFFPLNGTLNCDGVSRSLWGVQVTEMKDGVFIACTGNHAIIDGTSFWHFFNSWSEISRGFETISKTPTFERFDENAPVPLPQLDKTLCSDTTLLRHRIFHFSKENLAKLKGRANSEAESENISTLQALSAHLWRSTTRCRCSSQSTRDPTRFLMMGIGARRRMPLPDCYFGNAFYGRVIAINEAELLQKGLGYTAMKINELVAQQNKDAAIKSIEDWVKNPRLPRRAKDTSNVVMITSSPKHTVYENDFGWGKPIAVRSGKGMKLDGNMIVYPAAVSGAFDVEVCLAPETLQEMENDAEFMEVIS